MYIYREIYQEYCEAMSNLSGRIMEVIGMSLGVECNYLKEFFKGNESIMRLNYYPRCQSPGLVLGTGPHCDPTSLTILHQDNVSGLQVLLDNTWYSVPPNPNAFVVNIGDTFMVYIYSYIYEPFNLKYSRVKYNVLHFMQIQQTNNLV